jgi:hypothetical protein
VNSQSFRWPIAIDVIVNAWTPTSTCRENRDGEVAPANEDIQLGSRCLRPDRPCNRQSRPHVTYGERAIRFEGNEIEIQGDHAGRVAIEPRKLGYRLKK